MSNKKQLWALVAFLTIPVIFVVGGALLVAIDPEKLAGHTNYVRNFRLLQLLKGGAMMAMFGAVVVAWLVTCLLLVNAKARSFQWALLSFIGPIGLTILASLRDLGPGPYDLYERFIRRLNLLVRVAYEIGFFLLVWTLSWQMMLIKREVTISFQAALRGVSRDYIIQEQNASSGMWAFGELIDVMFCFALLYLLRPVCVNLVAPLFKQRGKAATPSPPPA